MNPTAFGIVVNNDSINRWRSRQGGERLTSIEEKLVLLLMVGERLLSTCTLAISMYCWTLTLRRLTIVDSMIWIMPHGPVHDASTSTSTSHPPSTVLHVAKDVTLVKWLVTGVSKASSEAMVNMWLPSHLSV